MNDESTVLGEPAVVVPEEWGGRPIAQWPRLDAGHSDDLAAGA